MRILAFSDVHGNSEALRLLSESRDIEESDVIVCCGDFFGYLPNINETIELFERLPTPYAVAGNHDRMILDSLNDSEKRRQLACKYGDAYMNDLLDHSISFLSNLPKQLDIDARGLRIHICHGTPSNPLEGRLYPDTPLDDVLTKDAEFDLLFCGHTHYRMVRNIGKSLIINPGSLGQPRDGKGFSYCIYDCDETKLIFKEVAVDKDSMANLIAQESNRQVRRYLEGKLL